MKLRTPSLLLVLLAAAATPVSAQWSSDPGDNLAVADAAGDQVQPKIAPTADGGCYISWFDNIANGFDVRLQRLDVDGNEQWPHDGILVFDRGYSSTQDYGLDVDTAGNALLAFRDDSGAFEQITAAQVSPLGVLLWGAAGVTVSNTTGFVAAPKIAGIAGGGAVVAWTQDASAVVQRLDAAGAPQWGAGVALTPGVGTYSVSDLHGAGADVILSMVHVTGAFYAPKHLVAQKFDAAGGALWGTTPLSVFDGGSLQFGNYPTFVPDGSGGAVFAWYDVSPLQCFAQHVLANGTEAFPHNGVAGSTNGTRVRVDPSVAYDAVSGSTLLFWTEQNSSQSQCGLSGQKFDAAGNRQWGTEGTTLIPVGAPEIRQVSTTVDGTGAFVFWTHIPSFGTDTLHGARIDAAGAFDQGPFALASTASVKSRLDVATGATGQVVLAWSDQRTDGGDILAQNVDPFAACSWYCGSGINANTYSVAAGFELGGTFQATVGISAPNAGALLVGFLGAAQVPLFGGELLVDISTPESLQLAPGFGASPIAFSLPIPNDPAFTGLHVWTQAVGIGGGVFQLTCAHECQVGY